jgi:hypothetical protein
MRKTLIFAVLLNLVCVTAQSAVEMLTPLKTHPYAIAVFVDQETYAQIDSAVLAYRDAVEADGLGCYVVIDEWPNPEAIKARILRLAAEQAPVLEGVVFVGEIPIPMIRDAQHLSSAFKMDQQRFSWQRSSIPSDRFYDDFDLRFKFLEQDSSQQLLFYYSLLPESPQQISREIYSARIKAPINGERKYELLKQYFLRVAAQKRKPEMLDNFLVFNGHGYHSESLAAWEAYSLALREQFPQLYQPGGSFRNYYHSMSYELKEVILRELQQPELDMAIFHAHGGVEAQYLLGAKEAGGSLPLNVAAAKLFLRSKLRDAADRDKPIEEVITYYRDNYDIPESWFADALRDSIRLADSLFTAKQDLYVEDILPLAPQAELVIFDECFNGAFQKTPYQAGAYIFSSGTVVAGVANSVNVKQDIWADEDLGMLNYGIRLGLWHQRLNYLESHIIGDPTFHFDSGKDLNLIQLLHNPRWLKAWKGLLNSNDIPIRALAVEAIYHIRGAEFEPELLIIYQKDPAFQVRLKALKCLAQLRTPAFAEILMQSVNDPYELIRRFTVNWMGVIGKECYLPLLAEKIIRDPSERVAYIAKGALEKISPVKGLAACRKSMMSMPDSTRQSELMVYLENSLKRTESWLFEELLPNIQNDSLTLKKRISEVRTFRNYQFQEALPILMDLTESPTTENELRVSLLEALGWYGFSHNRTELEQLCERLCQNTTVFPEVRDEALKTLKRLQAGANDPINP